MGLFATVRRIAAGIAARIRIAAAVHALTQSSTVPVAVVRANDAARCRGYHHYVPKNGGRGNRVKGKKSASLKARANRRKAR